MWNSLNNKSFVNKVFLRDLMVRASLLFSRKWNWVSARNCRQNTQSLLIYNGYNNPNVRYELMVSNEQCDNIINTRICCTNEILWNRYYYYYLDHVVEWLPYLYLSRFHADAHITVTLYIWVIIVRYFQYLINSLRSIHVQLHRINDLYHCNFVVCISN